jgi:uncharacterized protein
VINSSQSHKAPSIAIVGSGIAGLCAAWHLHLTGADVTVFESRTAPGIDSLSLEIPAGNSTIRADVPSRMFNESEWPELTRLYRTVGIETEPVDASQSFSINGRNAWLTTNDARKPANALGLLTDPVSRAIAADLRRLLLEGASHLQTGTLDSLMGDYLKSNRYSDEFLFRFLYPTLSSTVCTCSYAALNRYPALVLFQTLQNLMDDRTLMRARFGTSHVVKKLLPDERILRLNTAIADVTRSEKGMVVRDSGGRTFEYDHVVLAIQANQANAIVEDLTPTERTILDSFVFEPVQVVVHSDPTMMPVKTRDWRTFNMISKPDSSGAFCSVWLNKFHRDWPAEASPWFQSIWAGRPDDYQIPDQMVLARASMQRVVVTNSSAAAWESLDMIHQDRTRRLWFCGSWAAPGTPLLESGVVSANRVVAGIANICGLGGVGASVNGPDYCSIS